MLPIAFMNLSTGEYVLIALALGGLYLLWGRGTPKEEPKSKKGSSKNWKGAINYLEDLADSKEINSPEVQKALSDLRQLFTAKLGR